jgi:hypothetical protein
VRLLVVTSEPVSADALREAVGDGTDDAEVMVVAPALTRSSLRFWISDADRAIGHAEAVQEETVERLSEEGIDAAGDTGESDPLLAVQDALVTFKADRIVVFRHEDAELRSGEERLTAAALRERFDLPVEERRVTTGAG